MSGTTQNTILQSNLPSFASQMKVANTNASSTAPAAGSAIAITGTPDGREFNAIPSYASATPDTPLSLSTVTFMGQNLPLNNMPPYLGLSYIICVEGIYPSRS